MFEVGAGTFQVGVNHTCRAGPLAFMQRRLREVVEAVDWQAEYAASPEAVADEPVIALPPAAMAARVEPAWFTERVRACGRCDQHGQCAVWAKRSQRSAAGCCENAMQAYLKKPLAACLGVPPRWLPVMPGVEIGLEQARTRQFTEAPDTDARTL